MYKTARILLLILLLLFTGCFKNGNNKDVSDKNTIVKEADISNYSFLFVGMYEGGPALYKYESKGNKSHLFWEHPKEKVVRLSYSEDLKSVFFITASGYGKKGVFPYINNVKLYLIKPDSSTVTFISDLGSGLQLFYRWENNNSFKVIINSMDKKITANINQHTVVYSTFGKVLTDENKIFNISIDGYPEPLIEKKKVFSSDGKYSLAVKGTLNDSLFIIETKENKKTLITTTKQKLNKVEWTEDGNYLIFSTINVTPGNETLYSINPQTSNLFIYSIKQKKIIKQWDGGGIKSFFLKDDLLIFDDNFKPKSYIKIFNMKKMEDVDQIIVKGGAGLNNLPEIPDYSA